MTVLLASVAAYQTARWAEQGFADTMGLMTLRHGTDPLSWVKIHLWGAHPTLDTSNWGEVLNGGDKPTFTASTTTGEYGVRLPEIDFSRVAEWPNEHPSLKVIVDYAKEVMEHRIAKMVIGCGKSLMEWRINKVLWAVVKKSSPVLYSIAKKGPFFFYATKKTIAFTIPFFQAVTANIKRIHQITPIKGLFKGMAAVGLSVGLAAMTPTIKIRVARENSNELLHETTKVFTARAVLSTDESLSRWNIGVLGTLRHSFRVPPVLSRPSQVIGGVAKIALAGCVVYGAVTYLPAFVEAHKTILVASAVLALV